MSWPLTLAAQSPIADVVCASTDRMRIKLKTQFGTERVATGLRSPEEIVEIWSDTDGDWAMVIAYASGQSCIVAMGDHWQAKMPRNPA
ncbi:MAG: hypothetical protein N4A61_05935 [Pelagimonas sp.]|jgi:hypothetical protein|nr:hypothetical protein [Pelagimonas sp.]